jgi:hypothetical protein
LLDEDQGAARLLLKKAEAAVAVEEGNEEAGRKAV